MSDFQLQHSYSQILLLTTSNGVDFLKFLKVIMDYLSDK